MATLPSLSTLLRAKQAQDDLAGDVQERGGSGQGVRQGGPQVLRAIRIPELPRARADRLGECEDHGTQSRTREYHRHPKRRPSASRGGLPMPPTQTTIADCEWHIGNSQRRALQILNSQFTIRNAAFRPSTPGLLPWPACGRRRSGPGCWASPARSGSGSSSSCPGRRSRS